MRTKISICVFGPAENAPGPYDVSACVPSFTYGLEAESINATMLDFSFARSSSRRYIM
jgi:hypothetical protein